MSRLIVWGAGELGGRVAHLWRQSVGPAIGLTKTEDRHEALRAMNVEPRRGNPLDLLRPDDALLLALPGHTTQLEAVNLLATQSAPQPVRAVLISVTGYFGQARGVVSEQTPRGTGSRAASIAVTEQAFRAWTGANGVILRLGGLYSDTRGPFSALARRGKVSRLRPPDKTMALIHYDDAARAAFAALQHPAPENVYIAVTPPCPTRQEFYGLACRQLSLPEPEFDTPLGHPPVEYDVTRLRRDLLPSPTHPDWRVALTAPPTDF